MFRDTYLSIKRDSQGALRNSIALRLLPSVGTHFIGLKMRSLDWETLTLLRRVRK